MIKPATLCLIPAIKNGGIVSTPMRIAKNVVPQKMATAAKASHPFNDAEINELPKLII